MGKAAMSGVLHVVDSLGLGGAQTVLKCYFESRAGDAGLHLYGLRSLPTQIDVSHPGVHVYPSTRRLSLAPLPELHRIVRQRNVRVVHCHLFRAQVCGFLLKFFFHPHVALVFHEHGRAVGQEGESKIETMLFRWFLRLAWRRVDHFICISDHTRARLLQIIPGAASVTSVVANPVPIFGRPPSASEKAAVRKAIGVPEGAFVVGFASRLVERKGWRDFLDAVARVVDERPVYFLLAGEGEDRASAQSHVQERGLQKHGRLLGRIGWMDRFYACIDCFVMPSHWEPHGLAHLEAQTFAVPVVVANVPGLNATVQHDVDALLFEAGDVEALAKNIGRLASDETLCKRLADAGLLNSTKYTASAFANGLEAIYMNIGRKERA
jgi:glycosyltransferase involved in cell wall biosynthesis